MDAHKVVQSYYEIEREIKQYQATSYSEFHEISIMYDDIHKKLVIEKIQLHSVLQQVFPEIECIYSINFSKYVLSVIEQYPHPSFVKETSRTKI